MKRNEALQIMKYLSGSFHREALEEATLEIWVRDLCLLADGNAAARAAEKVVRSGDRFPTIHQFRQVYRVAAEAAQPPQIEPARVARPEWVSVWAWARQTGEQRWFPQQQVEHTDRSREVMSMPDYEQVYASWVESGRPQVGLAGV